MLCGGSGTRLWPLSRKSHPKQFAPIFSGKSLLDLTLERLSSVGHKSLSLVGSEEHRFFLLDALDQAGLPGCLVLEPEGKNTAAAIAIAAVNATSGGADPVMLICPADHFIPDAALFAHCVGEGLEAAESGWIVVFGVPPTTATSAYGYIRQEEPVCNHTARVAQFVEKPDPALALKMIQDGGWHWNSGIVLARASVLTHALQTHAPDILAACSRAMREADSEVTSLGQVLLRPAASTFNQCRAQSFDHAVLEKFAKVAVVPFKGRWSDVGSWSALAELSPPDEAGNRIEGAGYCFQSENSYIYSASRPVVLLGVRDLVVVDSADAVLVAHRNASESVKRVVADLSEIGLEQAQVHRRVGRPWGWFDTIDQGERFKVKRIGVKPGAALSLQTHEHRAEHWIVVKGVAEVTRDSETFRLAENQSTYITRRQAHRLANPGTEELIVIEVQSGDYLGEDDIRRIRDNYGRFS